MSPDQDSLLTGAVIGAAIEVHRKLGPGADEPAYETALSSKLFKLGIAHECQKPLMVIYKNVVLDCGYRMDILVERRLPLELKAVETLGPIQDAQILTYMRLGPFDLGLLLNFEVVALKDGIRRRVLSRTRRGFGESTIEELDPDPVVTKLLRSAVEVYQTMGRGLLRSCYEECLCYELATRGVPFQRKFKVPLRFEETELGYSAELPLVVAGQFPVICLSVAVLTYLHEAILKARLRQTGMKVGYLINFNSSDLGLGVRRLRPDN